MRRPIRDRLRGSSNPRRLSGATSTKYHMPSHHTFNIKIRVVDYPKKGVAKLHVFDYDDMVFHTDAVFPEDGIEVDVTHLHSNYRPQITGFVGDPTVELTPNGPAGETLYYITGTDDNGDLIRVLADYRGATDMGFGRFV